MDTTRVPKPNSVDDNILDAISSAKSLVDGIKSSYQRPEDVAISTVGSLDGLDESQDVSTPSDLLHNKMRSNILDLTTQVISNCTDDRDEYSEVISKIKKHIESKDIIHSGAVRALLDAIKGRSDVNATKVKMIDVCNKVLSGGKPSMVNNNITTSLSGVDKELIDLLSE